jgi:endonuclease III
MIAKSAEHNIEIFNQLDCFLKSRGFVCADGMIFKYAEERKEKGVFDLSRHIKGLIYAQLSNQTKWANVEPKLGLIDELFFNYDVDLIKKQEWDYFANGIFRIKCGNKSTKSQMANLHCNIETLALIEETENGIDFYYSTMSANKLVKILSANGKYKLKYVGKALAWEYLRNVGIDGIKPDVHTRRIMGANRLGYSSKPIASEDEVVAKAKNIANQTGLSLSMIDALLWSFCAESRANVCEKNPNCIDCPIAKYCNQRV